MKKHTFNLHKGVISYSAGRSSLDPYKFRVVNESEGKLTRLIALYPQLLPLFVEKKVIFINLYPATIGSFPSALFIDTYQRKENVIRSLQLAAAENLTCVVMGQPLAVADMLFHYVSAFYHLPNSLILAIGGYSCPHSLEKFIQSLASAPITIIQLYGIAEADAACLAAIRNAEGKLIYHQLSEVFEAEVDNNNNLFFINQKHDKKLLTGDKAWQADEGWHIYPQREKSELMTELENWTTEDWKRKTGYVKKVKGSYLFQLRTGESPQSSQEISFWAFCELTNAYSFLNKPNWE